MKALLSGNEAIALGAYHAGVAVAAAYPGTPSTEILENLARYSDLHAEWAPNEKVAMEVAQGASYAGVRAMVSMKHVGLNVAADPFFAASITGVRGGLVVVSADDPGMHSSQNEQDNRHYARFAKVPVLEPSDSQEAYEFAKLAFSLSERFDTPVMLRPTTRVSHSKSVVEYDLRDAEERGRGDGDTGERWDGGTRSRGEGEGLSLPGGEGRGEGYARGSQPLSSNPHPPRRRATFVRQPEKYVMIPAYARRRHPLVEDRMAALADFAESFPHNRMEMQDRRLGVISAGVAYQYAREVVPWASFLKLGMGYPLPADMIRRFAARVDRLMVVEELDPFIEEMVRGLGLRVEGKRYFPPVGELSLERVEEGFRKAGVVGPNPPAPSRPGRGGELHAEPRPEISPPRGGEGQGVGSAVPSIPLPLRPPVLCPGCPHTGAFFTLKKLGFYRGNSDPDTPLPVQILGKLRRGGAVVTGDIGCYTLSVLPPLLAIDTTGCMGASIGNAMGMEKAGLPNKVVAVIGDSTFLHSGIMPLLDVVYNGGTITTVILDNFTTAMTGHQEHPGTGISAQRRRTRATDLQKLVEGLGVDDVKVVDAFDVAAIEAALRDSVERDEPSVVIVRGACSLKARVSGEALVVDQEKCDGCSTCLRLGCPAIARIDGKAAIEPGLCVGGGCGLCCQVCPLEAIQRPPAFSGRPPAG